MISRRVFMKDGGLALVSLGFAPQFLARTVAEAAPKRKVLVTIFQRGAVDGLNMIVPFGERDYYASRPSIAIARPGTSADAALDLDGFFGLHPRLAPLKPLYDARQLAIVHACGSPDGTRSHFDAQDYMESATPGVKSTQDGWLNRYLHAREHENATPFRAVALAPQLPRALQGLAPALAIGQIGQFGIRAGQSTDMVQASFEAEYAAAADGVLNRTGRDAFDAVKMLKDADPSKYAAGERRPVSANTVRRGAPADRAAHQGRRRPRGRLRRNRQLGSPRAGGRGRRAARESARRLRRRHRRARARSRRSHERRHDPDDVGVRPDRGRERQSRHRSRTWERDDGDRRRRARRQGLRQVARPRARAALRRARSRRHDRLPRPSSPRSSAATWA